MSFYDYVVGFCKDQEHRRTKKCDSCGGSSLCEKTEIEESRVSGVFVCADCRYEKKIHVDMSVLRERFDTARKGKFLAV